MRPNPVELGELEALRGVVKFPSRIKCATLGLEHAGPGARRGLVGAGELSHPSPGTSPPAAGSAQPAMALTRRANSMSKGETPPTSWVLRSILTVE